GDTAIGRVAQHSPDHRAFPAACLASWNAFAVEPPRDLPDAESFDDIHLIDVPYDTGFDFIDNVGGGRLVRLADISVSIGSAAHYAHFASLRPGVASHAANAPGSALVHIPRSCLGTVLDVDLPRCLLVAYSRTPSRLRGE